MTDWPIAFHITFGTYGTRLHGDDRPTVARPLNHFGEPFVEPNEARRQAIRGFMIGEPLYLSREQRIEVERMIPDICSRGNGAFHIAAAQPDHVHCLLSTDADPKVVRKLLKRWLGEHLSQGWSLNGRPRWWAEGGSGKYVWDVEYFKSAYEYIERQKVTAEADGDLKDSIFLQIPSLISRSEPGCPSPTNPHRHMPMS
ncbi:MAG: hypothetical protein IPK83_07075 [Planctomycetes bacterium]|nr:hypothetical protein [Planctomycetota bacterium]